MLWPTVCVGVGYWVVDGGQSVVGGGLVCGVCDGKFQFLAARRSPLARAAVRTVSLAMAVTTAVPTVSLARGLQP